MSATRAVGSSAVQDLTVEPGLYLVHKRYAAGLRMPRHAHEEFRFCLALSGSYTDSWRRGYRTRTSRQLSLHPAGEFHTSVFHTPTDCFHIEFTQGWRERLLGDAGIAPEPQEFLNGRVPVVARQLYQEFRHADACSSLVLQGLASELIGWTARELTREVRHPPAWVFQARDLLHDRFNEALSLSDIAGTLDVHPVHLAREFKRAFGSTVGAYLRERRVEFVCRQLPLGARLADVALQAGFADQSHLTRVFKRLVGCTPKQFRARR